MDSVITQLCVDSDRHGWPGRQLGLPRFGPGTYASTDGAGSGGYGRITARTTPALSPLPPHHTNVTSATKARKRRARTPCVIKESGGPRSCRVRNTELEKHHAPDSEDECLRGDDTRGVHGGLLALVLSLVPVRTTVAQPNRLNSQGALIGLFERNAPAVEDPMAEKLGGDRWRR